MYISDRHNVDKRLIKVLLKCQIFVINSLRAKMLIDINILIIKDIDLIIVIRKRHIDNCRITFELIITFSLKTFIKQSVMFEKSILILIYSHMTMLIEYVNLFFKNYIFKFINECSVALFIIVINSSFHAILIRNDFKKTIQLS